MAEAAHKKEMTAADDKAKAEAEAAKATERVNKVLTQLGDRELHTALLSKLTKEELLAELEKRGG